MNEEKQGKTSKRQPPPIGSSIPSQYQSFGSSNGDTEDEDNMKRPATQVSKRPAVQTVEHPDTETSSSSNAKKSKHPDWKQQTVYLPPRLLKWLRVQAPQEEREISEIVTEALEDYRRSH